MGRHVHATEVGSEEDTSSNWVHKFWVGIQPSTVETYLNETEVTTVEAELSVDDEKDIRSKVKWLKVEFEKKFEKTYESVLKDIGKGMYQSDEVEEREMILQAAEINLGEHLLSTIKNMKKVNCKVQWLDIEL